MAREKSKEPLSLPNLPLARRLPFLVRKPDNKQSQENILSIQEFAEANRLRTKNNGAEVLIHGKAGEIADMGDPVDLTAQTAAITTTTLYAVPASGAGQYRVGWNAKVTTVAGTSS